MKAKQKTPVPEPMGIIMERQEEVLRLPPYRAPNYEPGRIEQAARAHGQAHESDPFAFARMALYLRKGYELPSTILKEAKTRIHVRELERRGLKAGEAV